MTSCFMLLGQGKYDAISVLQVVCILARGIEIGRRISKKGKALGKALQALTRRCAWPEIWQTIDSRFGSLPRWKRLPLASFSYRRCFIKSSVCLLYLFARAKWAGDQPSREKLHDEGAVTARCIIHRTRWLCASKGCPGNFIRR
jgi:hypothetical protein